MLIFSLVAFVPTANAAPADQYSGEYYQDALLSLLFPSLNDAITKHYGKQMKYDCTTITKMKKLYPNSYVFSIEIQARKYEKIVEPPYELLTASYDNRTGVYKMTEFKASPLKNNEIPEALKCRGPVRD